MTAMPGLMRLSLHRDVQMVVMSGPALDAFYVRIVEKNRLDIRVA